MIELRDYQDESINRLRDNIRAGFKNQVLSASTGAGKTVCAAYLLNECHQKGKRGIFVADRIALINQTSETLDRYGVSHGVIQSQHWRYRPYERIQVASAQTLARRDWPDADLIIIDECHSMMKTSLDRIAKRDAVTIGLTATPFSRGMGKYYDAIVSVTTTNKLIEQGHIVGYRVFASSEPDMTGVKVNRFGEWDENEAAERVTPLVGDCVAEYLKYGEGKKFIVFGCNVAHCEDLHKQFMSAGIQTELYTYRTDDDSRAMMVDEFKKPDGYIKGLISVSALAKGFDNTEIGVIIIARPLKKSLAEHIQMIGRGLRKHPGKEICTILDHAGNCRRFWNAWHEFFENGADTLDDGVRKEKKKAEKKEVDPVKCPKCHAMHNPMPACPSCGHIYPKRSSEILHAEGTLSEIGCTVQAVDSAAKMAFYAQLRFIAQSRGYADGWAYHKYVERFGVGPFGKKPEPTTPTQDVLNWVQSRQIAYANRRVR